MRFQKSTMKFSIVTVLYKKNTFFKNSKAYKEQIYAKLDLYLDMNLSKLQKSVEKRGANKPWDDRTGHSLATTKTTMKIFIKFLQFEFSRKNKLRHV